MKAMILAAGRGERMRPLTDVTPKPLLQVNNKALIVHHIERLVEAGVDEIIINHAWLGEQIPAALGDGSDWGITLQYSNEGDNALETAGGIAKALPLLGDDPFLVVNGDVYCDIDYASLILQPLLHSAHLVLVENPAHNAKGDFAISHGVLVNDGPIKYTFSGIGIYHPNVFKHITIESRKLAPILRSLAQAAQISASVYRGRWRDIGTPERLQELDSLLKEESHANLG